MQAGVVSTRGAKRPRIGSSRRQVRQRSYPQLSSSALGPPFPLQNSGLLLPIEGRKLLLNILIRFGQVFGVCEIWLT